MRVVRALAIVLAAVSPLAGCSWFGLDDTNPQPPAAKTQAPPAFQTAPVPDRRYE